MTRPDTRYAEARFRAADARLSAVKDPTAAILDLANGLEVLVQAILTERGEPTPDAGGPAGETSRNTDQGEHEHTFIDAEPLVSYSPCSHRSCAGCGLVQVLKFSGWSDLCRVTVGEGAPKVDRSALARRYWTEGPGGDRAAFRQTFHRGDFDLSPVAWWGPSAPVERQAAYERAVAASRRLLRDNLAVLEDEATRPLEFNQPRARFGADLNDTPAKPWWRRWFSW